MIVGFGSLWMMGEQTPKNLLRIALADNAITQIPIDGAIGSFHRTAIGEGAIWVSDNNSKAIYKIDPETNSVAMTIPANFLASNEQAGEIGAGEGAVWAITGVGDQQVLRRYSPQTGVEQATIPLPSPSARGLVVDFGSVWVLGSREEQLYRINPNTNQIMTTIDLNSRPVTLASGEGSVWVREVDGTVQRIDGGSGKLIATFATDATDGSGDMATGGGFVWISSRKALVQIDPQTNSQRHTFDLPAGAAGYPVGYGGASLWVGGGTVLRIKPPE
jgi:streptogramin lyase